MIRHIYNMFIKVTNASHYQIREGHGGALKGRCHVTVLRVQARNPQEICKNQFFSDFLYQPQVPWWVNRVFEREPCILELGQ